MNPIPDDELLSAYLDGELSEADRARAEQLLAEQPEARQLLEDLRALHGSFEGLPVHRLDQDFPARVLRGAEREILSAEPPGEALGAADKAAPGVKPLAAASPHPASERSVPPLQPSFGWARWRRPVAWAGLAMAAGLLLMVFDRNLQPPARQGQVAHAPSAPSEMRAANGPEPAPAGDEPLFARDGASHKEIRDEPSGATDRSNLGASREADTAPADGSAQSGRRAMRRSKSDSESSAPKAADPTAAPSEELGEARGQKPSPGAGSMSAKQTESFRLRQSGMTRHEAQVGGLPLYDVELRQDGKLVSEPLDENT
ncbi:MAG TPA: zf-HC2 domain-containing protein, partial [Pirellulales bacterium]|nr:zf-HC2 domain-containing protein [Pirellulales bacterium]